MNAFTRGIFIVIWIGLPMVAQAENWVSLGAIDISVDTDSVSRKDEFATITAMENAELHQWTVTFDCARKERISTDGAPVPVAAGTALMRALELACKRPEERGK